MSTQLCGQDCDGGRTIRVAETRMLLCVGAENTLLGCLCQQVDKMEYGQQW